jgi:hypothetical protein
VSSHATGFFPAASVSRPFEIHGWESGNDLSTLGFMEQLILHLIRWLSAIQPCAACDTSTPLLVHDTARPSIAARLKGRPKILRKLLPMRPRTGDGPHRRPFARARQEERKPEHTWSLKPLRRGMARRKRNPHNPRAAGLRVGIIRWTLRGSEP